MDAGYDEASGTWKPRRQSDMSHLGLLGAFGKLPLRSMVVGVQAKSPQTVTKGGWRL
jgi:hypothetical protein